METYIVTETSPRKGGCHLRYMPGTANRCHTARGTISLLPSGVEQTHYGQEAGKDGMNLVLL